MCKKSEYCLSNCRNSGPICIAMIDGWLSGAIWRAISPSSLVILFVSGQDQTLCFSKGNDARCSGCHNRPRLDAWRFGASGPRHPTWQFQGMRTSIFWTFAIIWILQLPRSGMQWLLWQNDLRTFSQFQACSTGLQGSCRGTIVACTERMVMPRQCTSNEELCSLGLSPLLHRIDRTIC